MAPELIKSIETLGETLRGLNVTLQTVSNVAWWNTQWFSAFIGAITGFTGSLLVSKVKERNERLSSFYQWFLKQGSFSSPQGLYHGARVYSYGTPDKPLGEKMAIELRKHTRYWYRPLGKLRFLLYRYEAAIRKIQNAEDIENQIEYKKAGELFNRVENFVYKKTGENKWTS